LRAVGAAGVRDHDGIRVSAAVQEALDMQDIVQRDDIDRDAHDRIPRHPLSSNGASDRAV
jgi:hypothetical protein